MALTVHHFLIAYSLLLLCSTIPNSCLASYYDVCNEVSECGFFTFSYPFGLKNSGCGDPDFQLQCDDSNPLINIGGDDYRILKPLFLANNINSNSMTIINNNLSMMDMLDGKCNISGNYSQFWLRASHFHVADTYTNLTIWGLCHEGTQEFSQFRLHKLCGEGWYYAIRRPEDGAPFCKTHLQIPIHKKYLHFKTNQNFLWQGFEVTWHVEPGRYQSCEECFNSNGRCGYNISEPSSRFLCYCPDGSTHPDKCPADNGRSPDCPDKLCNPEVTEDTEDQNMSAIAIGCFVVGVVATTIGLVVAVFLIYDACKRRNPASPPETLQGNGNDVANHPYSQSSLFTSTEKSSSIEIGV